MIPMYRVRAVRTPKIQMMPKPATKSSVAPLARQYAARAHRAAAKVSN